jgi:hypothetical protein
MGRGTHVPNTTTFTIAGQKEIRSKQMHLPLVQASRRKRTRLKKWGSGSAVALSQASAVPPIPGHGRDVTKPSSLTALSVTLSVSIGLKCWLFPVK